MARAALNFYMGEERTLSHIKTLSRKNSLSNRVHKSSSVKTDSLVQRDLQTSLEKEIKFENRRLTLMYASMIVFSDKWYHYFQI